MSILQLPEDHLEQLLQLIQGLFPEQQITEVKLKYNAQGQTALWVYTSVKKVHTSMRLKDILQKDSYQELLVKTEKGKVVFAQLITKKRL